MRRAFTGADRRMRNLCNSAPQFSQPSVYLSDLDFADDIELLSRNMTTAQKILTAVEKSAILVGLTTNKSKTEYMVCGEVSADVGVQEPATLSVDAGPIVKVDDFRYLDGWIKSSKDDFRHRVPQAWQACNSMWRVWKCPTLSRDCKRTLFQATVEPFCFTMPKRGRPHVPWRDVLMAYTHGFFERLSTFSGNSI